MNTRTSAGRNANSCAAFGRLHAVLAGVLWLTMAGHSWAQTPVSSPSRWKVLSPTSQESPPPQEASHPEASSRPASAPNKVEAIRLSRTLLLSVVLLLVFMVAAIAIIVFSRRFRAYLLRGKVQRPTQVEDVWSMHRLPEGAMDDEGERGEDEADDGDEHR